MGIGSRRELDLFAAFHGKDVFAVAIPFPRNGVWLFDAALDEFQILLPIHLLVIRGAAATVDQAAPVRFLRAGIHLRSAMRPGSVGKIHLHGEEVQSVRGRDRKRTRLNSSHMSISYAVFCLK